MNTQRGGGGLDNHEKIIIFKYKFVISEHMGRESLLKINI